MPVATNIDDIKPDHLPAILIVSKAGSNVEVNNIIQGEAIPDCLLPSVQLWFFLFGSADLCNQHPSMKNLFLLCSGAKFPLPSLLPLPLFSFVSLSLTLFSVSHSFLCLSVSFSLSFSPGPSLSLFPPGHTAPDQLMSDLIFAQEQHSAQMQYDLKEEVCGGHGVRCS